MIGDRLARQLFNVGVERLLSPTSGAGWINEDDNPISVGLERDDHL